MRNLEQLRAHPERLPAIKAYYRANPADFINDWGMTYDPRNLEIGLPATVPFILFPKQREWIDYVMRKWRERNSGLNEKSRECGVTWLAVSLACTLCIFHEGLAIGFGSRKTEYVDKIGTNKPILPKGRIFMENLPAEFRAGYEPWRDSPYMRINFPQTGSIIAGEGGDDIGRGDRTSIYFFDEAAHHPRQELVEASLSQTTNCRIDMSSVRGMNNLFAQKRWGGKIEVFIFDWRDDPRKDQAWYDKQCANLDPVVVAQEIDRDYSASVKGIVIPGAWVRAAIDAREFLGIQRQGAKGVVLDVADEGEDKNAIGKFRGVEVLETEEWSGKGSDIFETVEYAFDVCDEEQVREFHYDADGLGAGVRGDARTINDRRKANGQRQIKAKGYRGSGGVIDPEAAVEGTKGSEGEEGRTNLDYFANSKAQGWWALRNRFKRTFRWVQHVKTNGAEGSPCGIDEIISLSSKNPTCMQLVAQLSQATYKQNQAGKIVIEKTPPGTKSPNMADTVMIRYAPKEPEPIEFDQQMLAQLAMAGRMARR